MITRDQAAQLKVGDTIYHVAETNSDGTPQRWKVIGRLIQRNRAHVYHWKLPLSSLKRGLKHYDALTPLNNNMFTLTEEEAKQ